ncbi:MAG: hypothetical protein ACP5HX_09460 [Thermoproteota archaeon]
MNELFLSNKAKELYSRYKLTPEQTSVLVGSLFGDASLILGKRDKTPDYYENHAIEQTEYLKWKASVLGAQVKFRVMSRGYNKGKTVPYIELRRKEFTEFEKMFYTKREDGRRKKVVTEEALELLFGSALALAVFYMDDGEYSVFSNQCIFNTCDFNIEENQKLAKRFENLLGAPVRIKIKRKKYPKLALSSKATDKFITIVKPFIHPTMKYKIDQDISHYFSKEIIEKIIKGYKEQVPAGKIAEETGLTLMEIYVIAYRLGVTRK